MKSFGFIEGLEKWNDLLILKKIPGQRNFSGDVVETRTERKKLRNVRIKTNRKRDFGSI